MGNVKTKKQLKIDECVLYQQSRGPGEPGGAGSQQGAPSEVDWLASAGAVEARGQTRKIGGQSRLWVGCWGCWGGRPSPTSHHSPGVLWFGGPHPHFCVGNVIPHSYVKDI